MSKGDAQVGRRLVSVWVIAIAAVFVGFGSLHAEGDPTGCSMTEVPSPAPSACQSPIGSIAPSPDATTTLEIGAWDVYFDPTEVHAPATDPSRIVLTNHGYANHNLTIDELGVELAVGRGRTASVTLDGIPPGSYTFYCSVSGHRLAGMEGTLIVD